LFVSDARAAITVARLLVRLETILPLPAGEGSGEGESSVMFATFQTDLRRGGRPWRRIRGMATRRKNRGGFPPATFGLRRDLGNPPCAAPVLTTCHRTVDVRAPVQKRTESPATVPRGAGA